VAASNRVIVLIFIVFLFYFKGNVNLRTSFADIHREAMSVNVNIDLGKSVFFSTHFLAVLHFFRSGSPSTVP